MKAATVQITYTGLDADTLAALLWIGLDETHKALPTTEDRAALATQGVQMQPETVRETVRIGLAECGLRAARDLEDWSPDEEHWCYLQVDSAYREGAADEG